MNNSKDESLNITKIFSIIMVLYIVATAGFYFLAGDELKYRDSRGNMPLLAGESAAAELTKGMVVEQEFSVNINRLTDVSVSFGTFYRENSGTVTLTLFDKESKNVLMRGEYNAKDITEGEALSLSAPNPIEGIYGKPLILSVTADSPMGKGVAPLMNQSTSENWSLTVNGEPTSGTLAIGAVGKDYIWTGLHYNKFVISAGGVLALSLIIIRNRWKAGKHSYVVNAIIAIKKYRFLISQLVARDFKKKYKRSVLGVFWSFLNPLLTMMVQYLVFSTLFMQNIPNYPAYLLIGIVSFSFFSEAASMSMTSIADNASLITKVYIPKYIFPVSRIISSSINLVISIIPLILVSILTGVHFTKAAPLSLYFLVCLIVFVMGLGLLLSVLTVFFRDIKFLWGVISMMWMYATPIFYPAEIVPERFRWVQELNPLCTVIVSIRSCIISGLSPEPIVYIKCFVMAMAMLLFGAWVFKKNQDRLFLYL